jgi:hypothetical protein
MDKRFFNSVNHNLTKIKSPSKVLTPEALGIVMGLDPTGVEKEAGNINPFGGLCY